MGTGWTDPDLKNIENGYGFVWQNERFESKLRQKRTPPLQAGRG
jgi:hypothetical protein